MSQDVYKRLRQENQTFISKLPLLIKWNLLLQILDLFPSTYFFNPQFFFPCNFQVMS